MSGQLNHAVEEIIRQLLVDAGLGTEPVEDDSDWGAWPCFYTFLPDGKETPDNALCVYDTEGRLGGRVHPTGTTLEFYGIQVKVRATKPNIARIKANNVARFFDNKQETVQKTIVVESDEAGSATYLIHAITLTSPVLNLGRESPTTRRYLQTVNATASITMSSDT